MTEIHGSCSDRFGAVRAAFEKNFDDDRPISDLGASAVVTLDGEAVVDLWAGAAAPDGRPWERDTIVNVYSTTKTMAALSVLVCVDRGLIDPTEAVATYWPEFAANGKADITVAHVMSHSAGLAGFEPAVSPADLADWEGIVAHLAAQTPMWEPGTAAGYHAVTQGFLQGELVRRVTDMSIGTFFRTQIAEPLGADFHIGLDPSHDDRVGELVPPPTSIEDEGGAGMAPGSIPFRVLTSCMLDATEPRESWWRRAEIPAAGGIGNARSVGRVHSAIACGGEVDGVRILGRETIDRALEEQVAGTDLVMGIPARFGLGYGLRTDMMPLPNDATLYWGGWGGSVAIIDTENRLTITYVMNRMGSALMGDTRGIDVALAAYTALLS